MKVRAHLFNFLAFSEVPFVALIICYFCERLK